MHYLYLAALAGGLLFGVRIMFFGAERRRRREGAFPLRRWEPAVVAFTAMFGLAGYLLSSRGSLTSVMTLVAALVLAGLWAALVARLAIAMARVVPEHDPDDPRFSLQGHVAVITQPIPAGGEGTIGFDDGAGRRTTVARAIDDQPLDLGLEVCIERIDNGIAFVERWSAVEARL